MTNEEKRSKLLALMQNEDQMAELGEAASMDEVKEKLREFGLEMTQGEFESFAASMAKLEEVPKELTEEALQEVSGGVVAETVAAWTIITYATSTVIGLASGAFKLGGKFAKWMGYN